MELTRTLQFAALVDPLHHHISSANSRATEPGSNNRTSDLDSPSWRSYRGARSAPFAPRGLRKTRRSTGSAGMNHKLAEQAMLSWLELLSN